MEKTKLNINTEIKKLEAGIADLKQSNFAALNASEKKEIKQDIQELIEEFKKLKK